MIYGYIRTSRAAVDGLAGMHHENPGPGSGRCRGGAGQHRLGRGSLRLRPGTGERPGWTGLDAQLLRGDTLTAAALGPDQPQPG